MQDLSSPTFLSFLARLGKHQHPCRRDKYCLSKNEIPNHIMIILIRADKQTLHHGDVTVGYVRTCLVTCNVLTQPSRV